MGFVPWGHKASLDAKIVIPMIAFIIAVFATVFFLNPNMFVNPEDVVCGNGIVTNFQAVSKSHILGGYVIYVTTIETDFRNGHIVIESQRPYAVGSSITIVAKPGGRYRIQ